MAPKTILVMGGASGCVANIVREHLAANKKKYRVVVAGRTAPVSGTEFVHFDLFESDHDEFIQSLATNYGPIHAVVNCVSTGGKLSYDTTLIPMLNYVSANLMVALATQLDATLVHMSSLKVGTPEDTSTKSMSRPLVWRGPRSPYAWSKLAAEQKLLLSDLKDMSFIRIGLMDSVHGKKFYTRVRTYVNFPVTITKEEDLCAAIEEAIVAKGRHTISVKSHKEGNGEFYSRMAGGRWCFPGMPVWLFNFVFGHLLPTKLIDYCDPTGDFTYRLPF